MTVSFDLIGHFRQRTQCRVAMKNLSTKRGLTKKGSIQGEQDIFFFALTCNSYGRLIIQTLANVFFAVL